MEKYNGQTKLTEELTFTLNYADGTKAEVDRGVLFSIGNDDRMDIHIGISKTWELYGVYLCFMQFIEEMGMIDHFEEYLNQMLGQMVPDETEAIRQ